MPLPFLTLKFNKIPEKLKQADHCCQVKEKKELRIRIAFLLFCAACSSLFPSYYKNRQVHPNSVDSSCAVINLGNLHVRPFAGLQSVIHTSLALLQRPIKKQGDWDSFLRRECGFAIKDITQKLFVHVNSTCKAQGLLRGRAAPVCFQSH